MDKLIYLVNKGLPNEKVQVFSIDIEHYISEYEKSKGKRVKFFLFEKYPTDNEITQKMIDMDFYGAKKLGIVTFDNVKGIITDRTINPIKLYNNFSGERSYYWVCYHFWNDSYSIYGNHQYSDKKYKSYLSIESVIEFFNSGLKWYFL